MARKITIDPITRIEGHLRIDVEVNDGKVTNAWSSAQMWRGIEVILKGKDPRDAWAFAQRFCGVCTTVHAIASIRSVENALKVEVPLNAQYIRNILIAQHSVQDHIVHFYHLSALDWVDIVSALQADCKKAAYLAQSFSDWPGNSQQEFEAVKAKLNAFVQNGRLGIFASGYWGHKAMRLSPELNLILATHYLKALDYQRKAAQAVAILGGKNPHIQNLCVGGVATAVNVDNLATLNMERLLYLKSLMKETAEFVEKVYFPDLAILANHYRDWFKYGNGVDNYLAVPEFPLDSKSEKFELPGGVFYDGNIKPFRIIKDHMDEYLINSITESIAHSWYVGEDKLHPWDGVTEPNYTDFQAEGKYSWSKAPRFNEKPMEVGPVAQLFAIYASDNEEAKQIINDSLLRIGIKINDLQSTMGRLVARGIRAKIMSKMSLKFVDKLIDNLAKGDSEYANHTNIPEGEFRGVGFHEAPRGTLSHWIIIEDKKIKNYQAVVPSTWNASPRDEKGLLGPYEASLLDNPVHDPEKPLEVLRTIHSFDPCIACAVHTIDPEGKEIVRVRVL
ncbi:nickel-dependent hydrogenase large subunit [Deferribacterales bacterium Es71-Z0220]|uniref:nickel-dependent hydrogenase large subunit n=1 Tax=Deferrivibrio essentukiensis TaxID=2880922 RepID=UPI001F623720|nr:nickel-dependent hydrogenase large subunit [Deferrivibrio essentukiensis]MCB4204020.1 nickel-dependent hydrogenase large subunit [Deferrivibrio essentukiensis]